LRGNGSSVSGSPVAELVDSDKSDQPDASKVSSTSRGRPLCQAYFFNSLDTT